MSPWMSGLRTWYLYHMPLQVKDGDEKFLIVNERDILAVVD